MAWNPKLWASVVPRNPTQQKPNHYLEMARVAWENRDQLPFAWRILKQGTCDGCALGTTGLKDWTLDGVHLCMVRLELMRLNTAPALDPGRLADVSRLEGLSSRDLRGLGRLPEPMLRRQRRAGLPRGVVGRGLWRGGGEDPGRAARAVRRVRDLARDPERALLRGAEGGAGHGHEPRGQLGAPLPRRLDRGHEADAGLRGHDLLLHRLDRDRPHRLLRVQHAEQPARHDEVPLPRAAARRRAWPWSTPTSSRGSSGYWVPSVAESAVFGTRFADDWFAVDTGGDLAFLNGVLKVLVAEDGVDREFVARHTTGFDEARAHVEGQSFELLEQRQRDHARGDAPLRARC